MIPPGSWVVCPHCRVFADALAGELPGELAIRCPWCGVANRGAQWAEVAARSSCPECRHPLALHVAWYTADGKPPDPLSRELAHPTDAPCTQCACTAPSGSRIVVA